MVHCRHVECQLSHGFTFMVVSNATGCGRYAPVLRVVRLLRLAKLLRILRASRIFRRCVVTVCLCPLTLNPKP